MSKTLLAAVVCCLGFSTPILAQDVDRAAVARRFFDAFCSGDMDTLDALYAKDVKWSDPITSFNDRAGVMGMWRWESQQSPKFRYEPGQVHGDTVTVTWHADYKLNGNPIHNDVTATLTIDDQGHVVKHVDSYSWEKWSAQAFPGVHSSMLWRYIEGAVKFCVATTLQIQSAVTDMKAPAKSKGFVRALGGAPRK